MRYNKKSSRAPVRVAKKIISFFEKNGTSQLTIHWCFLKFRHYDLLRMPKDFLGFFIAAILKEEILSESNEQELVDMIHDLDNQTIGPASWILLYHMSLQCGLFKLGFIFRKKYKAIIISNGGKSKRKYLYLVALMEDGLYEKAAHFFKANAKFLKKEQCYYYKMFSSVFGNPLSVKESDPVNELFLNYIKNKTVALVGPISNPIQVDEDLIVVPNNLGQFAIERQGVEIDISYYDKQQGENSEKFERLESASNKMKFAVFKGKDKGMFRFLRCPYRYLLCGAPIFNGDPNAVPNIVFEMLYFEAKKIKIYNCDLMLSSNYKETYDPDDFERLKKDRYMQLPMFSSHDPISQYNFLNSLWSMKKIEGDSLFENVMQMGDEAYFSALACNNKA